VGECERGGARDMLCTMFDVRCERERERKNERERRECTNVCESERDRERGVFVCLSVR